MYIKTVVPLAVIAFALITTDAVLADTTTHDSDVLNTIRQNHVSRFQKVHTPEIKPYQNRRYSFSDSDSDGDEFVDALEQFGEPMTGIFVKQVELARNVDLDGDGEIGEDSFAELLQEYPSTRVTAEELEAAAKLDTTATATTGDHALETHSPLETHAPVVKKPNVFVRMGRAIRKFFTRKSDDVYKAETRAATVNIMGALWVKLKSDMPEASLKQAAVVCTEFQQNVPKLYELASDRVYNALHRAESTVKSNLERRADVLSKTVSALHDDQDSLLSRAADYLKEKATHAVSSTILKTFSKAIKCNLSESTLAALAARSRFGAHTAGFF